MQNYGYLRWRTGSVVGEGRRIGSNQMRAKIRYCVSIKRNYGVCVHKV